MTSPLCPKAECVLPPGHEPGHSFVRSASRDELHAFHRRVREWVAALDAARLTEERDELRSLILSDCDIAGYYGDNPESAMQCWREALAATRRENDELRAAIDAARGATK